MYRQGRSRLAPRVACSGPSEPLRNGATELLTSFASGDGGPGPFYQRIGFRPTGELDVSGEIILALDLAS
jgi:hypothetical protein